MKRNFVMLTVVLGLAAMAGLAAPPSGYHIIKKVTVPGTGGWDYVTVDEAGRRVYIAHATQVEVLDADTAELVGTIPNTPGAHGNDLTVKPLFQALYEANADVVIGGHDHDYERFAPQTPDGAADSARGIREFVVGTGGKNHRPFGEPKPNSELRDATAFGVLKLTLKPGGYDWQFIPEAGKSFTDSGNGQCH